jgi:hypothetical protein
MGLNHMNGRIEDAVTGRFLSPDPTVPDPNNTQSYNRYSYVVNNPLTLTDPSGFCYTGAPLAKCLPYGGGHNGRNDVVGPADSARSISGASFGEGSLGTWVTGVNADIVGAELDTGGYSTGSDSVTTADAATTTTTGADNATSSSSSAADGMGAGGGASSAQSQETSNSSGNGGAVGAFVGPAATAVEGATLAEIVVIAASTAAGVLLPDSTSSSDTTSNDSRIPVYRVVGPAELAYLQATGNYGFSPSTGGKYFALTASGAQAFQNAYPNGTLTTTTLPGSVLSQGYAFNDPGLVGAGVSVHFSDPQLPMVYGAMTPPVIIP